LVIALTGTINVSGQPVANFNANITSGCGPLTVQFTDLSTGNPTSWNWEFSNGTLSSAQNPAITFSTPGTFSVKLVVQNASGIAQVERLNYITVFPSPTVDFSANITLSCIPATINFTDLSSTAVGTLTAWDWDFGDGGTSTSQNPSHTYNAAGFYTVTLAVTSSTGCKTIISKGSYIRVVGGLAVDFGYSIPSSCQAPFTVNFQNQSTGPGNISYTWDFGNSLTSTATNPSTIYNAAGSYTVTLNAQSDLGCSGSIQKVITLTSTNTDFIAPANICLDVPFTFLNNSSAPPISSFWNFGDGTFSGQINPVKTFLLPGTYNVTLVNQYANCTDSITKTITVNNKPLVDFTVNDSTSCQVPFAVQFTDLTVGAVSWLWNFGDGNTSTQQNPSHTYNAFGNYNVSLVITTAGGCSNTLVKSLYIKIQPVSISLNVPNGGCIPYTYTPQATIQTLDPIVSYQWDLGEPGAVFNVQNPPPYTYTTAGSFTISLTVTTASGCTQTVSVPGGVLTGTLPIVNFSASPLNACASDTIQFTNTSVTTPGAAVTWQWDFGDGGGSGVQHPQHVFTDTGALTVTLIVSNNRCVDSIKQVLQVKPPVALFNYTFDCVTRLVTFRDSSLADPAILPLTYLWQMGDPANTQFIVQNPPPFLYPGPGTYNVSLTVTNGACSYTTTNPVIVANEPADFSINRNPVCKNEVFTLTAINSNAANIASYSWVVGGIILPGTGRSVSSSLPANGTYDVSLTITDVNGCTTTKTLTNYITVNGPTANFIAASPGACLNKTVTFTDLSTPNGGIASWNFNFGDGTQQNFITPPFTHTYTQLGGYDVSITITDIAGCKDAYTLPTKLLVTDPEAGFKADTFYCPAAALQFRDTSAGVGLSYLWTFGDGGTSTLQNPQHSYPLGNNDYTVKLQITDASGCVDTVTKLNYIKIRSPKAAFAIRDTVTICPPLRTTFTFQGSNYQSFYWDFGDGGQSTLANPSYFYGNYGTFIPTLYVQGPGGCVDSAKSSVTIHNPNNIQINYTPLAACNTLNVDFNLVVPTGFKFILYFADGTADSSGSTSLSHFYGGPSFNFPSLIIFDTISGCQVLVQRGPYITVWGAIPLFGMNKTQFCDTATVVFTDFTTKNEPIISTVWDFGDGTTSGVQNPTHTFTQPGTYIVSLNVTTLSNCSKSYRDTVFVYRTPRPSISGKDTICVNTNELFNGSIAIPDSVTTWQWTYGNGQTSSNQNININFATPGNQTIQLITSNKVGCSNTATKTIYVSPPPTATPVQDPITINVGNGADLLMNYTGNIVSYTWAPNTQLSCTDCATPFAKPKFSTTYTVGLLDKYGCTNESDIRVVVLCDKINFFIPNTFSPNGDGQNEVFFPRGTGLFRIKSMIIFDRWGEVVFEKKDFLPNDPSSGWTGNYKGKKASADVYIYLMEIQCENNTIIPAKGNITLLR
jgi:gliding motility-associated-like protein